MTSSFKPSSHLHSKLDGPFLVPPLEASALLAAFGFAHEPLPHFGLIKAVHLVLRELYVLCRVDPHEPALETLHWEQRWQ